MGSVICVELVFSDAQDRLALRPSHRQRLADLHERGGLLAAGPWEDDSGALLIFQLDEAEVRAELDADPYYHAKGVTIASVRTWTPAVGG